MNSSAVSSCSRALLKQSHPDLALTAGAALALQRAAGSLLHKIVAELAVLLRRNHVRRLLRRFVLIAVRLVMNKELARYAVAFAEGGLATLSPQCTIHAPVLRACTLRRTLQLERHWDSIQKSAPACVGAVVEYVLGEILDLAGRRAKQQKRARVTASHVLAAVANDGDLLDLLTEWLFIERATAT